MKAFRLLIFVLLLVGQSPVTSTVRPLPDRLSTAVADRSLATGFNGWVGRAVSGTVMRDFASYSAATGVAQASATTCLDLTGDERVTVADIDAVGAHWHQRNGDPGWETRYDLDGDGHVDVLDIMRVSAQWPRECVPPDPASIAPPLDRTVATDLASATSFLYTGPTPIQTGVVSGTIEARRVAVLRGRVQTRDGAPLSNVGITVLDHPEYGSTRTREDGMFDLVVNGGGLLTVQYARNEYLPVQRQVVVPWRDYVRLPNVVLITYDSQVTSINLGTTRDYQVAQGSPVSDTAGMRRATLLFPPNLQATMQMPAGNRIQQQAPSTLHVRASEYSVGTRGPEAMPAELPPNTGYTYAVEFSVDEATAAGALGIQFNEPSIAYLENFLNAGVGWAVPAGYYDRTRAIWIPSDNGRVVKILVTPTLRLDIPDGERQRLAALYQTGQTLWRVPTRHFSAWDYNWPFGPPPDAVYPTQGAPTRDKRIDDPCIVPGSTIACQNQILGETVPINGTPFNLTYQSDRTLGRKAANTLDIPLSGASVPASLVRIDLQIDIAGRQYVHAVERDHECLHQPPSLAAAPVAAQARAATADLTNRSYQFTWDGEDAYGRLLQGQQPAIVRIGYTYCGVYQKTDRFGYNGGGRITGSRTRDEITLWQVWPTWIGPWDVRPQGLGGWTLDIHHVYDPAARVVYPGYGGQRSADAVGAIATTVTPTASPLPDVAAGPDGSVYFPAGDRVYRLDAQGAQTVVAGTGVRGYSGDGGPATSAQLNLPHAVAVGPDGNVYIADTGNNLIRRVDRDGIITTIAGNRGTGYSPDGLPATEAQVYEPTAITLGADGALYILHTRLHLSTLQAIRRVGPDGMLSTPVGKPDPRPNTCSGDGGPAAQAEFSFIWDMDMAPDGSIYIATGCPGTGARVRRVTPDGFVNTVAGGGTCNRTICGDGGPATAARLELAYGIAAAQDGSFAIVDASGTCVRRVGSEGIISTVAGVCGTSALWSVSPAGRTAFSMLPMATPASAASRRHCLVCPSAIALSQPRTAVRSSCSTVWADTSAPSTR